MDGDYLRDVTHPPPLRRVLIDGEVDQGDCHRVTCKCGEQAHTHSKQNASRHQMQHLGKRLAVALTTEHVVPTPVSSKETVRVSTEGRGDMDTVRCTISGAPYNKQHSTCSLEGLGGQVHARFHASDSHAQPRQDLPGPAHLFRKAQCGCCQTT